MARTLVTGATGFIGKQLVAALLARGDEVTCLVRPERRGRRIEKLGGAVNHGRCCRGRDTAGGNRQSGCRVPPGLHFQSQSIVRLSAYQRGGRAECRRSMCASKYAAGGRVGFVVGGNRSDGRSKSVPHRMRSAAAGVAVWRQQAGRRTCGGSICRSSADHNRSAADCVGAGRCNGLCLVP